MDCRVAGAPRNDEVGSFSLSLPSNVLLYNYSVVTKIDFLTLSLMVWA